MSQDNCRRGRADPTYIGLLAWAADPKLEERKRLGLLVMGYLLITAILLYFAKRRIWSKLH